MYLGNLLERVRIISRQIMIQHEHEHFMRLIEFGLFLDLDIIRKFDLFVSVYVRQRDVYNDQKTNEQNPLSRGVYSSTPPPQSSKLKRDLRQCFQERPTHLRRVFTQHQSSPSIGYARLKSRLKWHQSIFLKSHVRQNQTSSGCGLSSVD